MANGALSLRKADQPAQPQWALPDSPYVCFTCDDHLRRHGHYALLRVPYSAFGATGGQGGHTLPSTSRCQHCHAASTPTIPEPYDSLPILRFTLPHAGTLEPFAPSTFTSTHRSLAANLSLFRKT